MWTHLRRDLGQRVDPPTSLRIKTVDGRDADARTAVHRAAFGSDAFTDERWHSIASGPAYARARCLLGYDGGAAVAAVTVWSAGEGRPGIIEPMGVHPEHRGRGHGVAITIAAAAALTTYVGAGLEPWSEVADVRRGGAGVRRHDAEDRVVLFSEGCDPDDIRDP